MWAFEARGFVSWGRGAGWLDSGLCDAEQSIGNFTLSKHLMSIMPLD